MSSPNFGNALLAAGITIWCLGQNKLGLKLCSNKQSAVNAQSAETSKTNKLQGQKQFEKSLPEKQLATLRSQNCNVKSKLFEP